MLTKLEQTSIVICYFAFKYFQLFRRAALFFIANFKQRSSLVLRENIILIFFVILEWHVMHGNVVILIENVINCLKSIMTY